MKILAIDQSADPNVVTVIDGDRPLHSEQWHPEFRNNQELFRRLQNTVRGAGLELADLDVFGVGLGPGSFTGVRCSVAAVQAIAMPGCVPVIGIASTDVIAAAAAAGTGVERVVVAGDARRGRIWYAVYACSPQGVRRENDIQLAAQSEFVSQVPGGALVVSPDLERIRHVLCDLPADSAGTVSGTPDGEVLAGMVRDILQRGEEYPPPVPIYLHPPVFVKPRFAVSKPARTTANAD